MRAVQQAQKQASITQQESEVTGIPIAMLLTDCSLQAIVLGQQCADRAVILQVLVRSLLRVVCAGVPQTKVEASLLCIRGVIAR